jgi:hypothetical protein
MWSCSICETAKKPEMNARKVMPKPTCDQPGCETDVDGGEHIEFLGGVYNPVEREMCMKL